VFLVSSAGGATAAGVARAAARAEGATVHLVLAPGNPTGNPTRTAEHGEATDLAPGRAAGRRRRNPGELGERALGFFHLGTGVWLMYLTWATVLNIANGFHLPV
jgi:hypothetical protein